VLLNPSPDQVLLRETTASFLDRHALPNALRDLRGDADGFSHDYWRRGAELGWTSLLASEAHGGGAVDTHPLVDLTLVAFEFGRHAAPGPLIPTNVAVALLSRRGGDAHLDTVADLMSGASTAAWCLNEPPPHGGLGDWALDIVVERDQVVINGKKRPVEAAQTADVLVVTGRTGTGLTNVVGPASTPGVSVTPMRTTDLSRRYGSVHFDDVRVPLSSVVGVPGEADGDVWWALQVALVIAAAESVGAMQVAFDMTLAWAFDRYSFGRPLASYQALKHRYADMKTWLEASHAIADAAALGVATGIDSAADLASAAAAFIGDRGADLAQDCVQLHGGIGVTFEHDLHVYMRRIVVNRTAFGTPTDHRRRLAALALAREATSAASSIDANGDAA
jgi:alkylation response protein AidB-like acyl-CoA dehydrogenase